MPKPRKKELIRCRHFKWRIGQRGGVWYADGRSNPTNAGRHSLGTQKKDEALRLLAELDQQRAEELGLTPKTPKLQEPAETLDLDAGRKLYEKHYERPRVTGGVKPSTAKKYRQVFKKFIPFAKSHGITVWNGVTDNVLIEYAEHLETKGFTYNSQHKELVTLKQALKWLIEEGHLQGVARSKLRLPKAESEAPYCWRREEVSAMVEHCRADEALHWLADVLVALACTGLRIGELVGLRWQDIDTRSGRLMLTDETGHRPRAGRERRQVKSSRSRSFPIHPNLAAVLDHLPRIDGYVFRGPRGKQAKADTVRSVLIRDVITPLAEKFPTPDDEKGFRDGRLHSFRHYFCSICANSRVPERMVMDWLGHADSEMIRHYYHLHDDEAQRRMNSLDFLGQAGGRSAGKGEDKPEEEDVEPPDDYNESA